MGLNRIYGYARNGFYIGIGHIIKKIKVDAYSVFFGEVIYRLIAFFTQF